MEIKEYAKKILIDSGCDEYTYGGEQSKYILNDLKEAFPNGMEFPYIDVANAILEMSHPKPIYKAPYEVYWNSEHDSDGYGCESFEEAKYFAIDTLVYWMIEQSINYPPDYKDWNENEIEDWDHMIYNCYVEVYKYNSMDDEYEEYWSPSYEDEKEICWLTYDELKGE